MRRAMFGLLLLVGAASGCSGSSSDDADTEASLDALGSSSAPAHTFVSPRVTGGSRSWQVVVMQNEPSFDGVLVFGHPDESAEADRLLVLDRRTGAITYLTGDGSYDARAADDLAEAARAVEGYVASSSIGPTDFVTDGNACFLKVASVSILAVAAVVAAPFVIEAAAAGISEAGAKIAEKGFQEFALQAARTAWASEKFRRLLAFKIVKDGVKSWLLFSDKGKQLTLPVRRQIHKVVHAKCTPPSSDAVTAAGP